MFSMKNFDDNVILNSNTTSEFISFNQLKSIINKRTINWLPHLELERITIEDYKYIKILNLSEEICFYENPMKTVKIILKILCVIPDSIVLQYLLIKINNILEKDVSLVGVFHDGAVKSRNCLWTPFLGLLKEDDDFIANMSMLILTKLICFGSKSMKKTEKEFYMFFLKDRLVALISLAIENEVNNLPMPEAYAYQSEVTNFKSKLFETPIHQSSNYTLLRSKACHFVNQYNFADAVAAAEEYHNNNHSSDNYYYMSDKQHFNKIRVKISPFECLASVLRCLQMVLRLDEFRELFVSIGGVKEIISILSFSVSFQVQYQLIYCLWILSFNSFFAAKIITFNVIPVLMDILSETAKEKITRIILAFFRNLIEKPIDKQIVRKYGITMVQCSILKYLYILEHKRYDDEDIVNDIEFLTLRLQYSFNDLNSFEDFATQIRSKRLEWTSVHKSAKFWHENAHRLNEQNYELLHILLDLLKTSKNPTALCVACFDIGEYVRHYSQGKNVLDQLGFKEILLELLSHDNTNVRYEALLSVQKLMVQNWQYLNRQLKKKNINVNHFVNS